MTQEEINDVELIEDYLSGRLSAEDSKAFMRRTSDDPAFRQLFEKQKYIFDGFEGMQALAFEERLKKYADEIPLNVPTNNVRRYLILVIALAIIVLFVVVFMLVSKRQSSDTRQMALEYYDAPMALTSRDVERLLPVSLQLGMDAFVLKDWKEAIRQLDSVNDPLYRHDAQYYLAHSYFNANDIEAAIAGFEGTRNIERYRQQSEWFLGLSFLSANRQNEAHVIFSTIAGQEGHFYRDRADTLLKRLSSE